MSSNAESESTAPIRSAYAAGDNWQVAAGALVRRLGALDQGYRLGILYVTPPFAAYLKDMEIFLRQSTGVPHWVGTVGHGVIATGMEAVEVPAMAAMVLPIAEDAFRVFDGVEEETDGVTRAHADWLATTTAPLIVAHADGANAYVPGLIRDLVEETDGYLVGGLACASGSAAQLADGPTGGGLSGVMIAPERTPLQTALTQGCSPIGPVHAVTRAEGPVILELDDRPALEVFKRDIGEPLASNLQDCAGRIFSALPVPGSDRRDYMVRPLTGIDMGHGAIAIGQAVSAGDKVLFCRRGTEAAVEDMRGMLADLKRRVGGRPVRGGLYVSCAARGPHQFRAPEREHQLIAECFGDIPLVGFFANGEISRDRLYGYTGVLTLFF
ncbi:FIST C-terminal domain-containing protein [Marivibrio halodurans]|uniref:FIST C-terminal domain-containing protein n=1 Tax=Marivibrio halodurans TaxID=2039722 RepID=A0A8J7V330_9PROT|nr:FIST N-terminal domain-containing protein [Marivibrio halodurans]MBP5857955.1 FIST C-terminal domain-containing protein [Marivibrio halodurans]